MESITTGLLRIYGFRGTGTKVTVSRNKKPIGSITIRPPANIVRAIVLLDNIDAIPYRSYTWLVLRHGTKDDYCEIISGPYLGEPLWDGVTIDRH